MPANTTRLMLLPGSNRKDSHNHRLLRDIARRIGTRCEIDMLQPDEVQLPLFNQDLERTEPFFSMTCALHQRFAAVDAVIVASPEYNGSVTPYLKNIVDWVSRLPRIDPQYANRSPFSNKPLLLTSASTGWTGGLLGLRAARGVFAYIGHLVVADELVISHSAQRVQDGEFQFDPQTAAYVDRVVNNFMSLVERMRVTHTPPNGGAA